MRVVFTDRARADLRAIAFHIAETNPAAARTFIRELRRRALELGDHPRAFPLVPRYYDSGVRRRVVRDYLILYRVAAERIEIVHITHGARDYEAYLFIDAGE